MKAGDVPILHTLRGAAALAVCLYHITNLADTLPALSLKTIGGYGHYGVEAFFVISGFVIPYSLFRAGYTPRRFGSFLLKRLARVEPPYLVSMALAMLAATLVASTPWYRGQPPVYTTAQVLAHLGYVNNLLGFKQIIRVYWTLGIEFQYYLLIGLLHSWITATGRARFGVALGAGIASGLVAQWWAPERAQNLVFAWTALFLMGIAAAMYRLAFISFQELAFRVACTALAGLAVLNLRQIAVGLATAAVIALVNSGSRWGDFLGRISYSLYLVHVPLGERVFSLLARFVTGNLATHAAVLLAVAVSLIGAWIYNRMIEEPARRWAQGIRYGTSGDLIALRDAVGGETLALQRPMTSSPGTGHSVQIEARR